MKRLSLVAVGLALVCTACGSSAPSVRTARPDSVPLVSDVKAAAAARKRDAAREADALLRRFVVPPGAVRTSLPHDCRAQEGWEWETVDRCESWQTSRSRSVVSYMSAYRLVGFDRPYTSRRPWVSTVQYLYGRRDLRSLTVLVTQLRGRIALRVDAQVPWIYPRSSAEAAPRATREIEIRAFPNPTADWVAPNVSLRVTDTSRVEQIVRWFDRLPVLKPHELGVASCSDPTIPGRDLQFVFRSAAGSPLARANVPYWPADRCLPIRFSIAGKEQPVLTDTLPTRGPSFVARVGKLLGVRLTPTPR